MNNRAGFRAGIGGFPKRGVFRERSLRRRLFLLASVIAWAIAGVDASAFAERYIGVILSGNTPYYDEIQKAFEDELRAQGIEGQIVVQRPGADAMAWRNAARKLVTIECDVIITYGGPATLAVMNETTKIPVVFGAVFDPEGLNFTGRNATGISSGVPFIGITKNLKNISDFAKLGVIFNSAEEDTVLQLKELENLGKTQGFAIVEFDVKDAVDPSPLNQADALFLTTSCAAMHCVQNFVGIARQNRIPTASTTGGGEHSGIVVTIAADATEQGSTVARLVGRVLKGEKTGGIPVERPKKVNFILNLKEARAVGLKVPFSVMTSATQVIQ